MIKKILKIIVFATIIVGLVFGGYTYYQYKKFHPSTDDAFVEANVVHIAPRISGEVNATFVTNHAHVKNGQLLFSIDPKPFQIALKKANANLDNIIQQVRAEQDNVKASESLVAERKAQYQDTLQNYQRITPLVKKHFYPAAKGDDITSQLKVARAALRAAKSQLLEAKERLGKPGKANAQIQAAIAAVAAAKLNLQYTKIYSPGDGDISQFSLRTGQVVNAYQQLFTLVENKNWWVTANFKETDLARIRPGEQVAVSVDMYPNHIFHGTVTSISDSSGASFSLLPPENATGNWVKVTQRFPVRIAIRNTDPSHPLRMGASASVTINTNHKA